MKFIKANPKDALQFIECWIEDDILTFPEMKFNKKIELKKLKQIIKNNKSFVLEVNKSPIGLICVSLTADIGRVVFVCIKKTYRNQGFGILLVKEAERYLIKKGARIITLNVSIKNRKALHLYIKNGFKTFRYMMKKVVK